MIGTNKNSITETILNEEKQWPQTIKKILF